MLVVKRFMYFYWLQMRLPYNVCPVAIFTNVVIPITTDLQSLFVAVDKN